MIRKKSLRSSLVPAASLALMLTLPFDAAKAQENPLPTIGGAGGGLISDKLESDIGRQVMTSIRRSTPRITDPLVYDYLTNIVYRLVPSAPLQNRDLTLTLIDNAGINAFAVPGGIVGVNGGLFLSAGTEQQFASVLAHELAHLSQRHFARRMEQQEASAPLAMAGMIAGIILSAATQSDIGIAAIAGSQALAIQNMLAYSRAHEQEADRVGLEILANAGLDPRGMPEMFEILMRENRLQGNQIPEYLSTHPLSQSRVADTRNRAEQYPEERIRDDQEYHLIRSRLQVRYASSPQLAVDTFEAYLAQTTETRNDVARYGLAVAYQRNNQAGKAIEILRDLLTQQPESITYTVTLAEALLSEEKMAEARALLRSALDRNPGNYPITYQLAETELADGSGKQAARLLQSLTRDLPGQEHLWLKLADAEGMARNVVGVHRARAEYEALMGDLESAQRQLRQAQEKLPAGSPERQIVTERLADITRRLNANRSG
ncbi:M48 family metalloprotease [Marinobacter sp. F4216]|uniref:M48 family metalloprotease n=1 Tax=Marinobacter sp. F4216 TaxID=2874281 RepID=UPI001CBE30CA|nr:M48 family metalloprotease [Marinobacter sp. F4216]MBZ2167822.1 M48 family metalloprotease [Marinobacter sp. F4216]